MIINRNRIVLFAVFILAFSLESFNSKDLQSSSIEVTNLRCEYLNDPFGIDNVNPRLSWDLISTERNKVQRYVRVIVASDIMLIENNKADMWDSGKIRIDGINQIVYKGKSLSSGHLYYWKVKVWDGDNKESKWSSVGSWSMGLIYKTDWTARWIGLEAIEKVTEQDKNIIPPSPLLRKEVVINKEIKSAFLFASALGLYEIYLNGKKVGGQVLSPEWTDYFTRVQYQTHDVTDYLVNGRNVVGATLADGWYSGVLFTHGKPQRGNYGFDRRLLSQMHIEYKDGTVDTVITDNSWKILRDGPIKEASIFDGEVYDKRYEPDGWLASGFDDRCWENVIEDTSVNITLCGQVNEPIRVVDQIKPVQSFKTANGTYIFDMGQNFAGWVKLSIPYNPGKKIILRYAEMLNEDSTLYVINLRTAKQTDIYIPGKEETIEYEPKFTYHGFRYVEISGVNSIDKVEVTGEVVASASRIVSQLETSNIYINKLWKNILWTQLSNMHGIPEDCPQRDERCGWMGDAQVFSQTAMFNMDMRAFYGKWFRDIRDMQTKEGRFPNYAPQVGMVFYDAPGWADAGVIIPWKAYINYGDKEILRSNFDAMCKFIDRVYEMNPNLIRVKEVGQNYGDWLNGNTIKAVDYPTGGGAIPKDVFSTAYFAYSTSLLAKASSILNKKKEYKHYDSLARAVRQVFITNFVSKDGVIKGNTQAGYGMALEFDLVPEALKAKVVSNMVQTVKNYDERISTGIHTTERFMNQLSLNGYNDIAFKLIESHRFPSWLYSIDQGATTIWERWDGYVKGRGFQIPGMNSFNHYAIGAVGE
ncbi:MAG: family 78 glycoside hydrolase catalytic domain, partial [Candidatus Kuenenia stuttgartiensis]|nr:family 78 glycoside hydrolase catalytic domain [Candidatus Kuenenia stuttgartiensis]